MNDEPKKRNRKLTPADIAHKAFKQVQTMLETEAKEVARHKERMGQLKMFREAAERELTEEAMPFYLALVDTARKAKN